MVVGAPSVPASTPSRPGWPSLKITTALAPASLAFCALAPKVQVPRCTSAMLPAGKPAKSDAAQPETVAPAGVLPIGTLSGPTAVTGAVTSPAPEEVIGAESPGAADARGRGKGTGAGGVRGDAGAAG